MYTFKRLTDKWKQFPIWSIEDDTVAFEVNRERQEILKQLETDLAAKNATIELKGHQRKVKLWGRIQGDQFWVSASSPLASYFSRHRRFIATDFSNDCLVGRLCFTPLMRTIAIVWMIVAVVIFVLALITLIRVPLFIDHYTSYTLVEAFMFPAAALGVLIWFRTGFRIFAILGSINERHTVAYLNHLLSPS